MKERRRTLQRAGMAGAGLQDFGEVVAPYREALVDARSFYGLAYNVPGLGQRVEVFGEDNGAQAMINEMEHGMAIDVRHDCEDFLVKAAVLLYDGSMDTVLKAVGVYHKFLEINNMAEQFESICVLLDICPHTGDFYDANVRQMGLGLPGFAAGEVQALVASGARVHARPFGPPTIEERYEYRRAHAELVKAFCKSAWRGASAEHVNNVNWVELFGFFPWSAYAAPGEDTSLLRLVVRTYLRQVGNVLKIDAQVDSEHLVTDNTLFLRFSWTDIHLNEHWRAVKKGLEARVMACFAMCMARWETHVCSSVSQLPGPFDLTPEVRTVNDVKSLLALTARLRNRLCQRFYRAVLADMRCRSAQQTYDKSVEMMTQVPLTRTALGREQMQRKIGELRQSSAMYLTQMRLMAARHRLRYLRGFREWQECLLKTVEVQQRQRAMYDVSVAELWQAGTVSNIMELAETIETAGNAHGCRFEHFRVPAWVNLEASVAQLDDPAGTRVANSLLAPGPLVTSMANLISLSVGCDRTGDSVQRIISTNKVARSSELAVACSWRVLDIIYATCLEVLCEEKFAQVMALTDDEIGELFALGRVVLAGTATYGDVQERRPVLPLPQGFAAATLEDDLDLSAAAATSEDDLDLGDLDLGAAAASAESEPVVDVRRYRQMRTASQDGASRPKRTRLDEHYL